MYSFDDYYPLDEYAFLACQTSMEGYQLVAQLNRCAGWHLQRIDMPASPCVGEPFSADAPCPPQMPVYSYSDPLLNTEYYLIDVWYRQRLLQQAPSALHGCDKILVVKGMNALELSQRLYSRLVERPDAADVYDLLAQAEQRRWQTLASQMVSAELFDLSNPQKPYSTLWNGTLDITMRAKAKMVEHLKDFFVELLQMIEEINFANTENGMPL